MSVPPRPSEPDRTATSHGPVRNRSHHADDLDDTELVKHIVHVHSHCVSRFPRRGVSGVIGKIARRIERIIARVHAVAKPRFATRLSASGRNASFRNIIVASMPKPNRRRPKPSSLAMSISEKVRRAVPAPPALDVARTMLYRSDMDEKKLPGANQTGPSWRAFSRNDLAVQVGTTNMSISRLEA